jgi:hypothetical protein
MENLRPALTAAIVAACAASPAGAQVRLQSDRWSEDWSSSAETPFKDIALGDGVHVDFGADARWKTEFLDNPRFGLSSQDDDAWLQQRLLAHANLRFGDWTRVFAQLGAHDVIGRINPSANDDNRFDLHQGFIDLTPEVFGFDARLRIGRQEIGTGSEAISERFFDIGNSAAIRRRFDGARMTLSNDDWRIDALSLNPVMNEPDAIDDDVTEGEHIFGALARRKIGDGSFSVYGFDHAREAFALAGVNANDRRRTYGARLTGEAGAYGYELDFALQDGAHGQRDVEAWGGYAAISRSFEDAPWSPQLTARVTYGSGDGDPNDSVIETYAPPLPRGSWFSEAGFTSHSNIVEAALAASAAPTRDLRLDAKLAGLWRADDGDFIYASTHTALAGTRGGDTFIGIAPRVQLTWNVNRFVSIGGEFASVLVSDRVGELGGDDAVFAMTALTLRY